MNLKKLFVILLVVATLFSAVSCKDKTNDITYREMGLTFTLPTSMRRAYGTYYDFHLSSPDSAFMAKKLDADFMETQEMPRETTAKLYTDTYITNQKLDRERIDYREDAERGTYCFKYNASETGEDYFHYITILGEPGAIWFVDIVCLNDKADIYTDTFEIWQATIRTYKE